ncbi:MAG: MFS transporter [Promethearchaeota archaeon]
MPRKTLLVGLSSFQFLSFLRRAIFYAFFYIYLRTFLGLSNTLAALLGTANFFTSTIGQLKLWGPKLNQQPEKAKRYVVRGELIAGIMYFIAFTGHRYLLDLQLKIGAAFFLIGILSFLELFWSMSDLGVRHLIAQSTESQGRGRTIGILDSMGLLGQITGFLLSGYLYQGGGGFQDGIIFYIVILLLFSCATVIQFLVYPQKKTVDDTLPITLSPRGLRELLGVRPYSLFLLSLFFLIMGIFSSSQIFLYYTADPIGLDFDERAISSLLIVFSLAGGLLTPLGGRISDQVGRLPVIVIGSIGATVSYLLLFLIGKQSFIVIALVYALLGASSALIQTISFAHVADLLPSELRGTGFALFNITLATGWGFAGFLVGGPIADILISYGQTTAIAYRIDFLVSVVVIGLGTSLLLVFYRKKRR